ncbi:DNA-binding protein [Candidatus Roizmanbacteria bacterium CG11_big_fil_rev_8_21_14_0_20_36_8]|uniref:DNA-binding protein n=2 Tax=Candidatus Roizmaniibacteriota TaxID=1752723 RepID=A0A2M6ITK5_9BACT|nr:MAG: DNA-binding protein [Candidatus Roizmanbacteria bacterium CG11_big_fil_rev_8_21_14_0_20_36_8]PIZ65957.1 MAG: DNA-binding protein [Candidatus Roizmanbacteria bacterium CG_4_10_14_0_2_um_filter_36_9]
MEIKESDKLQKAWVKSADEDLKTANDLFKLGRFSGCLFFCHLVIEKTLKAIYIKVNDTYPPPTHKLISLANLSKLELTKEHKLYLTEITTFNVEARYDIFKEKLYKKATSKFTRKYLDITKELFVQFKRLL